MVLASLAADASPAASLMAAIRAFFAWDSEIPPSSSKPPMVKAAARKVLCRAPSPAERTLKSWSVMMR